MKIPLDLQAPVQQLCPKRISWNIPGQLVEKEPQRQVHWFLEVQNGANQHILSSGNPAEHLQLSSGTSRLQKGRCCVLLHHREGSRALPAPRASCQMFWPLAAQIRGQSVIYGTQLCWETLMGADSGASWGHGWQSQGKAPPPHSSHSQISALWHSAARLGPSLSSFQIKLQKIFLCSSQLNAFKTSKTSCESNYFLDQPPYPCFRLINPKVFHQEKLLW